MKILSCNANMPLAQAMADYLHVPLAQAAIKRFSDNEIFVEVKRECARRRCILGAVHIVSRQ